MAVWLGGLLGACGGGGGNAAGPGGPPAGGAGFTVLMMGNSHTTTHGVPAQLQRLLTAGLPGRTVDVSVAPGGLFLDERSVHGPSLALLGQQRWSVVVLQAQKYSTSGRFEYSTAEALGLVQAARAMGAMPVMFPEWARRGVAETGRIYDIHAGIAAAGLACVAPMGQAWDLALKRHPDLVLHAPDGNHSAPAGAFLTALVLYATLTGLSPLGLGDLAGPIDGAVQARLRQVVHDTVAEVSPYRHCPEDVPLGQR